MVERDFVKSDLIPLFHNLASDEQVSPGLLITGVSFQSLIVRGLLIGSQSLSVHFLPHSFPGFSTALSC